MTHQRQSDFTPDLKSIFDVHDDKHNESYLENLEMRLRFKSKTTHFATEVQTWSHRNHHRAVVNLLTCLAGSDVMKCDGKVAVPVETLLHSYKTWVKLYHQAVPDCEVKHSYTNITIHGSKQITARKLYRKFKAIQTTLLGITEICFGHLDFTSGGKPRNNMQWQDVLNKVEKWWVKQQLRRKEMARRRRQVNKYNKTKQGQINPRQVVPLGTDWKPRRKPGNHEDPIVPLISRFVPLLCEGLGFAASPACFAAFVKYQPDANAENLSPDRTSPFAAAGVSCAEPLPAEMATGQTTDMKSSAHPSTKPQTNGSQTLSASKQHASSMAQNKMMKNNSFVREKTLVGNPTTCNDKASIEAAGTMSNKACPRPPETNAENISPDHTSPFPAGVSCAGPLPAEMASDDVKLNAHPNINFDDTRGTVAATELTQVEARVTNEHRLLGSKDVAEKALGGKQSRCNDNDAGMDTAAVHALLTLSVSHSIDGVSIEQNFELDKAVEGASPLRKRARLTLPEKVSHIVLDSDRVHVTVKRKSLSHLLKEIRNVRSLVSKAIQKSPKDTILLNQLSASSTQSLRLCEQLVGAYKHLGPCKKMVTDLREKEKAYTCAHVTLPLPSGFTRCNRASCKQPYAHLEPLVRVDKSVVDGYGLFARRDIKKNEIICMFSGTRRSKDASSNNDYILEVQCDHTENGDTETWYLDARAKSNAAGRYINDSYGTNYTNNAIYTNSPFKLHSLMQRHYVYIRALCFIPKDSEIFASYGNAYWKRKHSGMTHFILSFQPSFV